MTAAPMMAPRSQRYEVLQAATAAVTAVDGFLDQAKAHVADRLARHGDNPDAQRLEQRATHGLAWTATYATTLRAVLQWGEHLADMERFGPLEQDLLLVLFGEYLAHLAGGLPIGQGEVVRPWDMNAASGAATLSATPSCAQLIVHGTSAETRARLAENIARTQGTGEAGYDEMLGLISRQFEKFGRDMIAPYAHGWHMRDELIPDEVITQMAGLGVFGLTIPESYGGFGMDKAAMCVVSEELSRAYIGTGSLGTRSEIAAELILGGGTEAQKERWLPGLASGEILPTAVFSEPDTGSDLGSLKTRAVRDGDGWRITGEKTWITHGARADLMTVLARTDPNQPGYKGLSMFLVPKTRGSDDNPFPDEGLSGGEIEVLGYRGMKEYSLAFDNFPVSGDALLGGEEGSGFKHLMRTFESARIQTAARAVGVAQNAYDLGRGYALDRKQFGRPIMDFPRVQDKLAIAAAEIQAARQVTLFAAREKDSGRRCDVEAGMAKLLAARVAWTTADAAVQVHGGAGFALEYDISRVLCDARILNIFEGAAEIQAHVIARRLLEA